MARTARVVIPGVPHHVVQRGNRRQRTFFRVSDDLAYLTLLKKWAAEFAVAIWCYCLMPNHVHLIATPATESGLAKAIGHTHEAYTRIVNERHGWKGYLWQGRFSSCPMDEQHLLHAARYILLNPVLAEIVDSPTDWRFSSIGCHLTGVSDGLVDPDALAGHVDDWASYLAEPIDEEIVEKLRRHARTGRPIGDEEFVRRLERLTGRALAPRRPGRQKAEKVAA